MEDKIKQEPPVTLGNAFAHGMKIGLELNEARAAMRSEVAHRVKVLRLEAKLTQEELAKQININYLTYRGYENCRSEIPLVLLVRIADALNVSMDYLTGRTEEKGSAPKKEPEPDSMEQRLAQLEKLVATMNQK